MHRPLAIPLAIPGIRTPRMQLIKAPVRRIAKWLLHLGVRAVPVGRRFSVVLGMTRIVPLELWPSGPGVSARATQLSSDVDIGLHLALMSLNAAGVAVPARLHMEGVDALRSAVDEGRGVLLVAPHTPLARFAVRRLHDSGFPITVVTSQPLQRAAGSPSAIPTIPLSPTFLLGVREILLRGGLVFAMIDRQVPVPGLTTAIDLGTARLHVADTLLRLAVRCGSRIAFAAARAQERGIHCTIVPARAGDAREVTAEFVSFVQAHAAWVAGTRKAGTRR